jgi:hypothetical protein
LFDPHAASNAIMEMDVPCFHAAVLFVACDAYRKACGKLIEDVRIELVTQRGHQRRASEAEIKILEHAIDNVERFEAMQRQTMMDQPPHDDALCVHHIVLFATLDEWIANYLTASQRCKREQGETTGPASALRAARSRGWRQAAFLAAGARDASEQIIEVHTAKLRHLEKSHAIH